MSLTGELSPNFGNGRLRSTIAFSRTADETALAKAMGAMNDERLRGGAGRARHRGAGEVFQEVRARAMG